MKSKFFLFLAFALAFCSLEGAYAHHNDRHLKSEPNTPTTEGDKVPDVLAEGRLDAQSGAFLIDRIRVLLINAGVADPFNRLIPGKIYAAYNLIPDSVDDGAKKYVDDLGELLGMDITRSRFVITVEDLSYEVGLVGTDIRPTLDQEGKFVAKTKLGLANIRVGTKNISAALKMVVKGSPEIPNDCFLPSNSDNAAKAKLCDPFREYIVKMFDVSLLNPAIETKKDLELPVTYDVSIRPSKTLQLKLIDSGFGELRSILKNTPDALTLSPLKFAGTPDISFNIGTRKVTVDSDKIEEYIQSQALNIRKILVDQLVTNLKDGVGNDLLNALLNEQKIRNDLWFGSSIYTGFQISDIQPSINNQFSASLSSSICSAEEYLKMNEKCSLIQAPVEPVRDIPNSDLEASKKLMKEELAGQSANLALSVSEHYVNRILAKSVELKMWDEALQGTGIVLGPKKSFVVFDDQNSTNGTLFIDAVYPLPRKYRILLGTKYLRFALIYKVNMYFKNTVVGGENIPLFTVKVYDAELSRRQLVGGIPDYTEYKGRLGGVFKRKIAKVIKTEGSKLIGKEILSFDLPVLKNLGLEKAKFRSDGHGRLMGSINVNSAELAGMLRPAK